MQIDVNADERHAVEVALKAYTTSLKKEKTKMENLGLTTNEIDVRLATLEGNGNGEKPGLIRRFSYQKDAFDTVSDQTDAFTEAAGNGAPAEKKPKRARSKPRKRIRRGSKL